MNVSLKAEAFTVALSPQGLLYLLPHVREVISNRIQIAFSKGSGDGLKQLGLWELGSELPSDLAYWREFSQLYFSHLCALPGLAERGSAVGNECRPQSTN